MTKREIVKKLESLQSEKLVELTQQKADAVKAAMEAEMEPHGLKELCERTEKAIMELAPEWEKVLTAARGGVIDRWSWNSSGQLIASLAQKNMYNDAISALLNMQVMHLPKSVQTFYSAAEEKRQAVQAGYGALIAAVKNSASAKQALELLEKEGVDMTLFEDTVAGNVNTPTSLTVPLDLNLLGLKKGA